MKIRVPQQDGEITITPPGKTYQVSSGLVEVTASEIETFLQRVEGSAKASDKTQKEK